jgi:hypothetical protein
MVAGSTPKPPVAGVAATCSMPQKAVGVALAYGS